MFMAYGLIAYRIEDGKLQIDYSQNNYIHVEETEKAILVIEADMLVCRLFLDFTDHRFGDAARKIRNDLRSGNELTEDVRRVLDDIFEDILTFVEFYENRMTSLGSLAIARIMVHVRFAAAMLLRIDRSRAEFHKHSRSNKKMNSALFRHDSKDEIEDIYHLDYKRDVKRCIVGSELDYKAILDSIRSKDKDGIISYYDRFLADLEGDTHVFNVRLSPEEKEIWRMVIAHEMLCFKGAPCAPLFELIEIMIRDLPKLYRQYVDLDYKDMVHDNVRVIAPALGRISNRDSNLNASKKSPSEMIDPYDKRLIEREILFARVSDSILGCSKVERNELYLTFPIRGTMRLLDSRLFGWRYDLPPVIFCMDSKNPYDKFMRNCEKVTEDGVVVSDWIRIAQSDWITGKRMRAGNRVPGGVFKFGSIEFVTPKDLSEHMKAVKESTTIVTNAERMDEVISLFCSYTTVAERSRVGSVIVISPVENYIFPDTVIPYSSLILIKEDRLLDVLSLHNVRLIELAVDNYLAAMASELGVSVEGLTDIVPEDLRTAIYLKFAEEASMARRDLVYTRKLLDSLE